MSSPGEYYNSLPPVTKAYGTLCLLTTTVCQLGLLDPSYLALYYPWVFSRLQVWRLLTCFFFLGKFSINFGIRLLMIARYGVHLERGPFDKRTADFLWMMIFGAFSLLSQLPIPFATKYSNLVANAISLASGGEMRLWPEVVIGKWYRRKWWYPEGRKVAGVVGGR